MTVILQAMVIGLILHAKAFYSVYFTNFPFEVINEFIKKRSAAFIIIDINFFEADIVMIGDPFFYVFIFIFSNATQADKIFLLVRHHIPHWRRVLTQMENMHTATPCPCSHNAHGRAGFQAAAKSRAPAMDALPAFPHEKSGLNRLQAGFKPVGKGNEKISSIYLVYYVHCHCPEGYVPHFSLVLAEYFW